MTYDDYGPTATEAEAHSEWHAVTGRRYGCPWDACSPPDPEAVEIPCALDKPHGVHSHDFDSYCPGVTPWPTIQYAYEAGPDDPAEMPF